MGSSALGNVGDGSEHFGEAPAVLAGPCHEVEQDISAIPLPADAIRQLALLSPDLEEIEALVRPANRGIPQADYNHCVRNPGEQLPVFSREPVDFR